MHYAVRVTLALAVLLLGVILWDELRTSRWQAHYFSGIAKEMWHWVGPGPSDSIRFPQSGPYDHRLGYAGLPRYTERLLAHGYGIEAQARHTPELAELLAKGYSPPFLEKSHAGLTVLDCRGEVRTKRTHPPHGYTSFEAVPPLVRDTLLFIENRRLLDASKPLSNPAVDWPRLATALLAQAVRAVDPDNPAPGASTLVTQMEKYRHSPAGITASAREKFRQMYSASLRAYAAGPDTLVERRAAVVDYLNTVPLSAVAGYGEVNGFLAGLQAWYGIDPAEAHAALRPHSAGTPPPDLQAQARVYRAGLSLLIAQRRPSDLLRRVRGRLEALTDSYLRLLADAGVITGALRDAALRVRLDIATRGRPDAAVPSAPKATYAVRKHLLALTGAERFYDMERLDVDVSSAFDGNLQREVSRQLQSLADPQVVKAAGLDKPRLAGAEPSQIVYSFTLYEKGDGANYVRVQTDSGGAPFDINEGSRIELGSTAKLRTLASYLDLLTSLHGRYAVLPRDALAQIEVDRRDRLTRWILDFLADAQDASLPAMLQAALDRRYSASPAERFFTGGGVHRFNNYSSRHNGRSPTIGEAFRQSINLPFVRLMRDIVDHHIYGETLSAGALLDDPAHPQRKAWLERFADYEGRIFLARFHERYRGLRDAALLDALGGRVAPIPARLAVTFRSVLPLADRAGFAAFLHRQLGDRTPMADELDELYDRYGIERFSLHDRGYIASRHPLELWTVSFLARNPGASLEQAIAASATERQEVYRWLHRRSKQSQNTRMRTLLEIDAFEVIHRQWARLGYPFDELVPSYATSIGVSGDNPAALAELIGIVVNGGVRQPAVRVETLHFARDTPYETLFSRKGGGERVLHPAVAEALHAALADVVAGGTARRARGAYVDASAPPLSIGGKTGTGDNRHRSFASNGALTGTKSVSRTATFAFFLGERHFGVISAYVPAPYARAHRFTSALPVQVLSNMAPLLLPYVSEAPTRRCGAAAAVEAPERGGPDPG